MRRCALVVVLVAACGGKGHHVATPGATAEWKVGKHVRITDGGQIYDALNVTDCVKWPSAKVKQKAGRNAWGGFTPSTGSEGTILAALDHCDGKTEVVLVQVDDYIVPVTTKGLDTGDHAGSGSGTGTGDASGSDGGVGGFGYGTIGGYGADFGVGGYGGGVVGGVVGDVGDGGVTNTVSGGGFVIGDSVDIVNPGDIYDQINNGDCLTWPNDDTKQKGGASAWNGWSPSTGEVATVVFLPANNCGSSEQILLVDDAGNIVPIGISGVKIHK